MSEENIIEFRATQKPDENVENKDNQIPTEEEKFYWYQISYMFSTDSGQMGWGTYLQYRSIPLECVGKDEMKLRVEAAKRFVNGNVKNLDIVGILYLGYGTMRETVVWRDEYDQYGKP